MAGCAALAPEWPVPRHESIKAITHSLRRWRILL